MRMENIPNNTLNFKQFIFFNLKVQNLWDNV